jgi:uncharacterized protein (TIGR00730 family)
MQRKDMQRRLRNICVFCGSSMGARPIYRDTATRLGTLLAELEIGLVYGGAHVGLMGILADSALAAGGEVIGIIPQAMVDHEIAHTNLTRLEVVCSMHERKKRMADLSDAFIAMPGGFGTIEEFCEVLTWNQLGIHTKPCGLLNTEGYYDGLLGLFDHGVEEQFIRAPHRSSVLSSADPMELLNQLEAYEPPVIRKWI